MKKRGLSEVMTTLIIILLVLVAIGIVWVVASNIIRSGSEQISLGKLTLDLSIKSASIENGVVTVTVHRNPGAGELSGVQFILSDGVNTELIKKTGDDAKIGVLGEATFTLTLQTLVFVKEISVRPLLKSSTATGSEIIGEIESKKSFTEEQTLEGASGLVSWWDFEGDAEDKAGDNDGTLFGGVDCNAPGKVGKACEFDGVDGYVNIGNDASVHPDAFSVSVWFKTNSETLLPIMDFRGGYYPRYDSHLTLNYGHPNYPWIRGSSDNYMVFNNSIHSTIIDGNWHNAVFVVPGKTIPDVVNYKLYIDGVSIPHPDVGEKVDYTKAYTGWTSPFDFSGVYLDVYIGKFTLSNPPAPYNFFPGAMDEIMFFNKSLSASNVKALYEMNK